MRPLPSVGGSLDGPVWRSHCRPRLSGNTPAARAPIRHSAYGDLDTDFADYANVADYTIRDLAYEGWRPRPPDLVPRDDRFNDHQLVSAPVSSYRANAWNLHDMHGNVFEWTISSYRSYPYRDDDGRNETDAGPTKVVRGGSWYDRPKRCRSAFRLDYPSWQKLFNVGFRVVVSEMQP